LRICADEFVWIAKYGEYCQFERNCDRESRQFGSIHAELDANADTTSKALTDSIPYSDPDSTFAFAYANGLRQ
jgi:hypothetical protein